MAQSLLKIIAILSLTIHILLAFYPRTVCSETEIEEDENYLLDTPFSGHLRSGSRFLAHIVIVKKGARCERRKKSICNGVSANKGSSLLFCCKKHCRNVLSDKNNCGKCGRKCRLGERCCHGRCLNVLRNQKNCGKCGRRCSSGVRCEAGLCGYA